MKKFLGFIAATFALSFFSGTAQASTLEDYAVQKMTENHFYGKVKIVKKDVDNAANGVGFGYADQAKKVQNQDNNVLYPSASLQKVATGAMMVQIITESQKTDEPVSQYTKISRWFPNLKGADKISVGQLMTQTGGIVDPDAEHYNGPVLSEDDAVQQCINRINKNGLQNSGKFQYNNDNFILLAGIIRSYTGKSYEQNLTERIIKPAKLTETYMWNRLPSSKIEAVSYQYANGKDYQNAKLPADNLMSYILGAGNMYTTPADYYRLQQALCNGKILNQSDFNYLTNLKSKNSSYSGGMYIQDAKTEDGQKYKMVYGSLSKTNYSNWVKLTLDNGEGVLLFLNQVPSGVSVSSTVKSLGEDILDKVAQYKPTNNANSSSKAYYTITNAHAPMYNNLDLTEIKQYTDKFYQNTYLAKKTYQIKGKTYYSLYNNQNRWLGYVSEKDVRAGTDNGPQGVYFKDQKYYSVKKNNIPILRNLQTMETKGTTKDIYQNTYLAKRYYNPFDGHRYYSLYDHEDHWLGYLPDTGVVQTPEDGASDFGTYFSVKKAAVVKKKDYKLWRDYHFKKYKGKTTDIYKKNVYVAGQYHHFNGPVYYSIYNNANKDKWLGYVNKNAIELK